MAVRVLVVDDSPDLLDLLTELITSQGWECHEASNGIDALKLAQEINPSLVVSDIQMPGMNGLELLRSIKADSQLRHIPVMIVSSSIHREEALASGCDAFLSKPFNLDELISTMRNLVSDQVN